MPNLAELAVLQVAQKGARAGALPQFSGEELLEFRRSLGRVTELLGRLGAAMTPRDRLFLEIGLRGAHMEEALASGDFERVKAHWQKLEALARTAGMVR